MKFFGKLFFYSTLMALLVACGKDNKSGRSGSTWDYSNPYYSPYGAVPGLTSITSTPYAYNGVPLMQVINENPCVTGYNGMAGYSGSYSGQRIPVQIPLTNFPTVVAAGEVYVGVTSYGDVAAMVGTAAGQPPMFVAYLCPRSFSQNGQGQLMGIKVGAYSQCAFKPITAATMVFPGGASADFRMVDFGSSRGSKFSFCR